MSRILAVMLNGQEMLRVRWSDRKHPYKPTFHKPEDVMPEFLKPRVLNLDDARQTAAEAGRTAKARPMPPPEVVQKKWAALAQMRIARSQKTGKRKQA